MNSPSPKIEEYFTHLTLWRDALVTQHDRTMVTYPSWPGSPDYRPNVFVMRRRLADSFFFVIALRNFWRAADLLCARLGAEANRALEDFVSSVPDAATLRNVIEHFDSYIEGQGRTQELKKRKGEAPRRKTWLTAWLQALSNGEYVLKVTDGFVTYKVDLTMAMRASDVLYNKLSELAFGRIKWIGEP
jgi:hypothetical protein